VSDVAAILLAAGQSKRMGAFKPLLPFGNQTVIESCIDYLNRGGVSTESIVVVLGHRAQDVVNRLGDLSVQFALNPDPDSQMTASITAGLQKVPTAKAILIALVDHPAVPATVVSALISEWRHGARLVIPTWQNQGGHPVLVDCQYVGDLQNLDPNLGLKSLFRARVDEVKRLPVNSPFIARDMDTWDDYVALYTEVFGVAPPSPPRD
jgi:molybdenum cofactor cytidylyltransferase